MMYSVLMPLLAQLSQLDQKSDPTSLITPIPKGNQNDKVTREHLQISKQNFEQLEQTQ